MKFNKSLIIFSFLLVALLCISSAAAGEDVNIDDNSSSSKLEQTGVNIEADNELISINNESVLSAPKTIHVEEIEENHNEMVQSTIQMAIDGANAGDTIIIDGRSYVHCHFVVNKKLTIITNVGTTMTECPSNTKGSGYHGIFYISPEASGTVIEGFDIGFNKNNQVDGPNDYGIFVEGASDVVIRNCKVSTFGFSDAIRLENAKNANLVNVTLFNANNGLRVINSENITVSKSNIRNTNNGINIIDSSQIRVNDNFISNNNVSGIAFSGNGRDLTIIYNNVTDNFNGVRITSANHVYILSNYISFNTYNGVYVDNDIIKIEIKGNFFNQNHYWEVFNDFHVTNLKDNGNELEIVDNNYMINYGSGTSDIDRPIWTQVYDYLPGYGEYNYDAANDRYIYVGEMNGDYWGHQGVMFIAQVFEINEFMSCPNIYYAPAKVWTKYGNFMLQLSNITQVKKGVYSISIVNENGTIASDISSVPVTFYLNKAGKSSTPQEGDVYQTVMMKNGTATVTFSPELFNESGNVITAVFPTPGTNIDDKVSRTFSVKDSDIPGSSVDTRIISSNVYMVPNMNEYYVITLKDASGNVLPNQRITFAVNGKVYNRITNSKGQASVLLKFAAQKTYLIKITFAGNDNYNGISRTNNIIVKYSSKTAKLTAPTITILPNVFKYYTVTLKDANGKALAKQKVTIKVNGKTYIRTTNAKGQAGIKVKFTSLRNYKVIAGYNGNKIYKKAVASGMIRVSKIATKITAPTVSTLPNQLRTYSVVLKTSAGKVLPKQKVTIKVNGKTYTRLTNAKGIASVTVKFAGEKSYLVIANYKGNSIYKASKANGKIVVSRIVTQITSHDRTYAKDAVKDYQIILKDKSGNALAKQTVKFTINGKSYSKATDANGVAKITISNLNEGTFNIVTSYSGNAKYKAVSKNNKITVTNQTNINYVDGGLINSEIQAIIDGAGNGDSVVFLGDSYDDVSLNINKPLNICSKDNTILIAKKGSPVLSISADNVNVTNLVIKGNSGDGIVISDSNNVAITSNSFINNLDESKIPGYVDGTLMLPGYGIHVSNSTDVELSQNCISQYESGIFAEHSSKITIDRNTLRENNYGVKYGFGVANTLILNNEISDNIGLYIMTVPEGPSGYGIFLNNSAVNVTINKNHIAFNHLGISIDANNSTGIVITQNTITDNVLEGIRFNAGYDLASDAVEPLVVDNAIYRNARGPSMMILGELSANPDGIYNTTHRLNLDPNWYGTNTLVTWDYDTGVVGYGTMCPRINTTGIGFNVTYSSGRYIVTFYKNGEIASNLPKFDMFATLNNQIEVNFIVIDGIGSFNFNATNYKDANNFIDISIGSLLNSTSRVFKVTYHHDVLDSEIPNDK